MKTKSCPECGAQLGGPPPAAPAQYPRNVTDFVQKWQPAEPPRRKAFWKEFRKAANAYSKDTSQASPLAGRLALGQVAAQIVQDYRGVTIGGDDHQIATDQLTARINRALVAAINGEVHSENVPI